MRYSTAPVSEALLYRTFYGYLDGNGKYIGNGTHYFALRSTSGVQNLYVPESIETRYTEILKDLNNCIPEEQMAIVYHLYYMRRWTEALALAAAVVDNLQKELVFKIASTKFEGEAMLRAYRYQDIFNKVFPEFEIPKLCETDPRLWQAFNDAKKERGLKVHGDFGDPFDSEQKQQIKRYLTAYHDVARWLKQQLGGTWMLDTFHEGKRLEPFP